MKSKHENIRWEETKERLRRNGRALDESLECDESRLREVYHQRALHLAQRSTQSETISDILVVLVFSLSGQRYGIPLNQVAQAFSAIHSTPVPGAPRWVFGITNFEGQIRPVVDLVQLMGGSSERPDSMGSILLLRAPGRTIGLRVDRLEDIQKIDLAQLMTPDRIEGERRTPLVRGITPDHVAVVCVETLLAQCELGAEVVPSSFEPDVVENNAANKRSFVTL